MRQISEFKIQSRIVFPFMEKLVENRSLYFLFKRLLDVIGAGIALMVLLPFLLLIAILIRLDSAGPVIFSQKRVGTERLKVNGEWTWRKKTFTCYKFRTMHHKCDPALHQAYIKAQINHDEQQQAKIQKGDTTVKKLCHDPRVTRIGRYLRRSSMDELPQFWNILTGEMSLVGPRPAIPYEVDMYKPWYSQRLNAKPGLTGLWQISGRSSLSYEEMVELDIQYIQQQSLGLDLRILFNTPLVILSRKGVA
jgi:lipopolysaccharide/colanic/teichoic acid biosynthesis glycosyltransferase